MNPLDNQLDRLLKSAAAAPAARPGAAVFALETRVMANWRGLTQNDGEDFLIVWFRRAATFGCMLALASLAWSFHARPSQTGAELAIANSAMNMGVEP
jgi:hypothetical protein